MRCYSLAWKLGLATKNKSEVTSTSIPINTTFVDWIGGWGFHLMESVDLDSCEVGGRCNSLGVGWCGCTQTQHYHVNKDLSRTRLDRGSKLLQLLTRILHLFIPDVFFFRIKVSSNTWDHMPLRNLQEVSLLFHLKKQEIPLDCRPRLRHIYCVGALTVIY